MTESFIGMASFFGMLIIHKTIIEPLATAVGRKLLDKHLGKACALLDESVERFGLDFNPEDKIREYLALEDSEMNDADTEKIIAEVFKQWDLRVAAHN
jgi:hypothetical protein